MAAIEWNATVYHEVSNPHVEWGSTFVDNLDLRGDETVVDAGCGTGRVLDLLLQRIPSGRAYAVDQSENMLIQARKNLSGRYSQQVSFVQSDLIALRPDTIGEPVDLVFSTATFHWIRDHNTLFSNIFELLKPGGRLDAQCGGGPNIARLVERANTILSAPPFAHFFESFDQPKFFADDAETATRLKRTGFDDVETTLVEAPTILPDRATFSAFLANVIYREHLSTIEDEHLRTEFIESLTDQAEHDDPPFLLDYWRLNMHATRPGRS